MGYTVYIFELAPTDQSKTDQCRLWNHHLQVASQDLPPGIELKELVLKLRNGELQVAGFAYNHALACGLCFGLQSVTCTECTGR